jgi:hypothetical protein
MPLSVLSGDDLYIKCRPDRDGETQENTIRYFSLEDAASAILVNDIASGVYMSIGTRNEQSVLFVELYDPETSYDNRNLLRSELDYYLRYCTKWADDYTPVINTIPDYYVSGNIARTDDLKKKQDNISDLAAIRSGASKGATAIQTHQDISHLAEKTEVESLAKEVFANTNMNLNQGGQIAVLFDSKAEKSELAKLDEKVETLAGTGEGSVIDVVTT